MACVLALTLATSLAMREPALVALVRRENVIVARDPLRTEIDPQPDKPWERRPGLRATVLLPGQITLYVTATKDDVMSNAPCRPEPPLTPVNTPRVDAESRPPP